MTQRIVVLGNCQAAGVGVSLRTIMPDADVRVALFRDIGAKTSLESLVDGADLVVSQPSEAHGRLKLEERLADRPQTKVVYYPSVYFPGFQPDCCYLFKSPGKQVSSPLGSYHSRIVIGAHATGLSERRAARLFNPYIFARDPHPPTSCSIYILIYEAISAL